MKFRTLTYFAAAALLLCSCTKGSDLSDPTPPPTPPTPQPEVVGSSQGWADNYGGVMLQGFSWDSFDDTQWTNLTSQADELSKYFSLIWVPQSGDCHTSYNNMGYMPVYYFKQNSSFGTEAELRTMIKTFKAKGTGIVADVVINHRNNLGVNGSWVDFPAETYKGVTYQMFPADVTANDDNGNTAKQGYMLSQNADEGEDWGGCRDLDHKSKNVQKVIKAYVKYLKDDLGYTGFRYDMVKGYDGIHIANYNDVASIDFSVGEYWDANDQIERWINRTNKKSAAFDFQFRYNVRDAANGYDWSKLNSENNLIHNPAYRRYAVTFVENHDMQDRGNASGYTKDPINNDVVAANAYMLAMPGTPCVFLPHWKKYKSEIKAMIDIRKTAGITNTASYRILTAEKTLFRAEVTGKHGKLIVCVGQGAGSKSAEAGYTNVLSGEHYAYLLEDAGAYTGNTIFFDQAEGTYYNSVAVKVTSPATANNAQLVYTLDGSAPSATAAVVPANGIITIDKTAKLSVGILLNGTVTTVVSHNYTIISFAAHKARIYFKQPAGWNKAYIWAWDATNPALLGVQWPGLPMLTTTINGDTWYYYDFDINTGGYTVNVIFNQVLATGRVQTKNITGINKNTYYELGAVDNTGKYGVVDVTSQHP